MEKQVSRILKGPLFAVFLIVLLLFAYCYFIMPRNILDAKLRPSHSLSKPFSFDYNFLLRKNRAEQNVCILILSDEESMPKAGFRPSMWKGEFAAAINKISECSPKVIISDLMIWRSEDNKVIADAIKRAGNVILGYQHKNGSPRFLDREIKEAAYDLGAADIISPTNELIRTFYIYELGRGPAPAYLSLPIKVAFMYRNIPLDKIKTTKERNFITFIYENEKISLPITEPYGDDFVIHYQYEETDIPAIPICSIIEGNFNKSLLKDKIVFLSSEPYSLYEKFYNTPLGNVSSGLIMANIINSVVYSNFLRPIPYELNVAIMCLVSLFLALLFYKSTARNGFIILLFIVLFSVGMSFWLLTRNIYWSYFDMAVFSIISYAAIQVYKAVISRLGQKTIKK